MIKAIETTYRHYTFRSRLEARWAVFFDDLEIPYRYEPEGFELPSGRYLPDFFLPTLRVRGGNLGIFLEIKHEEYEEPKYDTNRWSDLVKATKHDLIVAKGLPPVGGNDNCEEYSFFEENGVPCVRWDSPMILIRCYSCGHTRFEFLEGNYMTCPCGFSKIDSDHPFLLSSLAYAEGYRF